MLIVDTHQYLPFATQPEETGKVGYWATGLLSMTFYYPYCNTGCFINAGLLWPFLACFGLLWATLGYSGLLCATLGPLTITKTLKTFL